MALASVLAPVRVRGSHGEGPSHLSTRALRGSWRSDRNPSRVSRSQQWAPLPRNPRLRSTPSRPLIDPQGPSFPHPAQRVSLILDEACLLRLTSLFSFQSRQLRRNTSDRRLPSLSRRRLRWSRISARYLTGWTRSSDPAPNQVLRPWRRRLRRKLSPRSTCCERRSGSCDRQLMAVGAGRIN